MNTISFNNSNINNTNTFTIKNDIFKSIGKKRKYEDKSEDKENNGKLVENGIGFSFNNTKTNDCIVDSYLNVGSKTASFKVMKNMGIGNIGNNYQSNNVLSDTKKFPKH